MACIVCGGWNPTTCPACYQKPVDQIVFTYAPGTDPR